MPLWNEAAIAVKRRDGEPFVLCEGTLGAVVATLLANRVTELRNLRISLPDRGTAPFAFEGRSLRALLDDAHRPTVAALPLRTG